MGKCRTQADRERETNQGRETKDQGIEEVIPFITQDSTTTIPDVSHVDTSISEINHDRPNNEPNTEPRDRPKAEEESTKVNAKNEQEDKQNIQKDISYLKDAIYPHWQAFIQALGNPRNWFLTKEDFEIVKAYFSQAEANINANIMEYLRNASDDPCSIHKALQFITIRKLGTIQIQAHKNRIDAILTTIQHQSEIYKAVAQSLAQVVQSFTNSYKLASGLSQFELPNIVQDLKAVGVIGILTAALTSIGIEIGNLKNDLRNLIRFNEFCIRPCRQDCRDTIPLSSRVGINNIAKEHETVDYNEGIELGNESEVFLRILEKLANIELEYIEQQIREGRLNLNRKSKNNNNNAM